MENLGLTNTVNPRFWKGVRVFVTGHTGFKGSWISLWLQAVGAQVTGYALRPNTDPSLFEIARVAEGMVSLYGDVRDLDRLEKALQRARPTVVIHMAAQPLVRDSYSIPVETFSTNVMGTVNLLQAVRSTPDVRAVVNVTTDKCYENREWLWGYREDDRLGGYDPYSSSKGCAELVTSAFRRSFFNSEDQSVQGVAVASVRAGNVIGGGDWARDRLIPDAIRAFQRNDIVDIRSPKSIRPWQHVLEPLRGYLMLAERLVEKGREFAEAWNFGPNDEDAKPVEWIVKHLAREWGKEAKWSTVAGDHPHEAAFLKLDISKAKSRLGWRPVLSIEDALVGSVAWYRQYYAGSDMRKFTESQISKLISCSSEQNSGSV